MICDLPRRLRRGLRDYLAAVLLNLALLNVVLTPPVRRPVVQMRVIAGASRFHATELLVGASGEPDGVLSLPLAHQHATSISLN